MAKKFEETPAPALLSDEQYAKAFGAKTVDSSRLKTVEGTITGRQLLEAMLSLAESDPGYLDQSIDLTVNMADLGLPPVPLSLVMIGAARYTSDSPYMLSLMGTIKL